MPRKKLSSRKRKLPTEGVPAGGEVRGKVAHTEAAAANKENDLQRAGCESAPGATRSEGRDPKATTDSVSWTGAEERGAWNAVLKEKYLVSFPEDLFDLFDVAKSLSAEDPLGSATGSDLLGRITL